MRSPYKEEMGARIVEYITENLMKAKEQLSES
jgi:hypothetical protein